LTAIVHKNDWLICTWLEYANWMYLTMNNNE